MNFSVARYDIFGKYGSLRQIRKGKKFFEVFGNNKYLARTLQNALF